MDSKSACTSKGFAITQQASRSSGTISAGMYPVINSTGISGLILRISRIISGPVIRGIAKSGHYHSNLGMIIME